LAPWDFQPQVRAAVLTGLARLPLYGRVDEVAQCSGELVEGVIHAVVSARSPVLRE
jgi:hypothetical protein